MSNTFVLSGTNAGKTCTVVMPIVYSIIQNGESAFVHDPKGELYKSFYPLAKEKGYKIIVLDFRDPSCGDSFSVLKMAGEMIEKGEERGKELLDVFLSSISKGCASNDDPFWHLSAHLYLKKLSEVIIREYGSQSLSLKNNMVLHRYLNEKIGSKFRAREYYDSIDTNCPEKGELLEIIEGPSDTKKSIYLVVQRIIENYVQNKGIEDLVSTSTFSIEDLVKDKVLVYFITRDETSIYDEVVANYLHTFYSCLIDVAERVYNGCMPRRINWVLEEAANMAQIPEFGKKLSASRARNFRWFIVVQSLQQLQSIYPNDSKTLIDNCNNLIYLYSSSLEYCSELSEKCGYKDEDRRKPLVTPYELQHLKKGELLAILDRNYPYLASLPDFSKILPLNKTTLDSIPLRETANKCETIDTSKLYTSKLDFALQNIDISSLFDNNLKSDSRTLEERKKDVDLFICSLAMFYTRRK